MAPEIPEDQYAERLEHWEELQRARAVAGPEPEAP